jgi:hypothetical protein
MENNLIIFYKRKACRRGATKNSNNYLDFHRANITFLDLNKNKTISVIIPRS